MHGPKASELLCQWASIGITGVLDKFKGDTAIGVMSDEGRIIAAVVYCQPNARPDGGLYSIEMNVFSVDKRWATRHTLRAFFDYPFNQLKLDRVQTLCSAQDRDVIMFNKRIGFTQEGEHPMAWPMGGDAVSFGMLKDDCKWI